MVRLAQPERYVRIFVDVGEPLAQLLRQTQEPRVALSYSASLLAVEDKVDNPAGLGAGPARLIVVRSLGTSTT
jgi:hypothetical protein